MGFVGKAYLVLYNAVMACGWGQLLLWTFGQLGRCASGRTDIVPSWLPVGQGLVCSNNSNGERIFEGLKIFQTLAILEVVHALIGLVSSSAGTVLQQVTSRVVVLWAVIYVNEQSIDSAGFSLTLIAWTITEVIRYSWYALKELLNTPPKFLTWCRYTFFIVLYPMGVTGEQMLNYAAVQKMLATTGPSQNVCFVYAVMLIVFMLLYIPLFPGLYLHMFAQRKKVLAPKKPVPVEAGIQFPKTPAGDRSTTLAGQLAFAMSVASIDPQAAAAAIRERNWRFGYARHVLKNVEICCRSTEACVKVCEDGLNYLHNNFEFVRDGKTMSLAQAMKTIKTTFPYQMTIKGSLTRNSNPDYVVKYRRKPYPAKCEVEDLHGEQLLAQLNKWAQDGTIEPSARDAIGLIARNQGKWLDLSNRYFVLLGAGSAMGPYEVLMQYGANVIGLDINIPRVWTRLIAMARNSCGTLTFPMKVDPATLKTDEEIAAVAGSDLFKETPEICNWLCDLMPDKEFTIGGYAYLDGELHVRVSLAMDAIMAGCCERRTKTKTGLAYLCSPTDVFVCQPEARDAMLENYKKSSLMKTFIINPLRLLSKKICVKNALPLVTADDGKTNYAIVDGLVVPQGPNYALAKRLQHWRAMLQRHKEFPVSTNIAPSTATISVVHNKQFAAAYGGFQFFPPMEVSYQETSNAVMGALLIHDICNPQSKAQSTTDIGNPVNLFMSGSFHGGIWRGAYKIGSIGEVAALLHYLRIYSLPICLTLSAAVVGAGVVASKLLTN